LHNHLVTVHGLDFGIPAEMTAFPAFPDLCITARAGAWEVAKHAALRERQKKVSRNGATTQRKSESDG